jgi:hypothetical protein
VDNLSKGVKTNIFRGTSGELLFAYEAQRRGLYPCSSVMGETPCFDMVVINANSGRPVVVQIRTAKFSKSNYKFSVRATCKNNAVHLRDTNVQYLCVFAPGPDVWYFIPIGKIASNTVTVYGHNPKSKGMYEKFKENWRVFGSSLDGRGLLN